MKLKKPYKRCKVSSQGIVSLPVVGKNRPLGSIKEETEETYTIKWDGKKKIEKWSKNYIDLI